MQLTIMPDLDQMLDKSIPEILLGIKVSITKMYPTVLATSQILKKNAQRRRKDRLW